MSCKPTHRDVNNGKPHAAFVAILAKLDASELLKENEFKNIKENPSQKILMVHRWDGRIGFPGGKVDEGETLVEAAMREVYEEAGFRNKIKDEVICSYELPNINVHVFVNDLGTITQEKLVFDTSIMIVLSKTYGFEVCPFWAPFSKNDPKSLNRLLENNNLVPSVKESLLEILKLT
jgi:U8 snoRNA-decapping enzyme